MFPLPRDLAAGRFADESSGRRISIGSTGSGRHCTGAGAASSAAPSGRSRSFHEGFHNLVGFIVVKIVGTAHDPARKGCVRDRGGRRHRSAGGRAMNRLFCFGFGYVAQHLAAPLIAAGWSVAGTLRDAAAPRKTDTGSTLLRFTRDQPLDRPAAALAGATHVLLSIPPDESGDPVLAAHGDDLASLPGLRWVGYLSSTSVYGDRGGDWVDETARLAPSSPRARGRAAAEAGWLALRHRHGLPVHLFRLAAIYGPGRNALLALEQGRARRIDRPGQVFSRIHVEDLVAVLRASMTRPDPGRIYNVCDDDPAPPGTVVAFAAALLGMPPPPAVPIEAAGLSPLARSFYADNKRVANRRIKDELGVRLRYPSYRDGLAALVHEAAGRS